MRRTRRRSAGFHSFARVVTGTGETLRARLRYKPRPMVSERRINVDGVEIFVREAPAPDGRPPVLYIHGVPTNADDWTAFLERTGGIALDLPGFGRSDKPNNFDYSIDGYGAFLEAFAAAIGLERYSLVMHDWGSVGLMLAQAAPERVERLVIMNAVPFLPGYRWHRTARLWRAPLLGELSMGFSSRALTRFSLREGLAGRAKPQDAFVNYIWDHFDQGTQRAILRLYRASSPDVLARAGEGLGGIKCPALVVWGAEDPYLPARFADDYAQTLGGDARVEVLDGVRHWPWVDRPEVVDSVTGFLLD